MAPMMPWRRTWLGLGLAVVLLAATTITLSLAGDAVSLPSDLLIYLVVVAVVAATGGLVPGVATALAAVGLINYFFTEPLHTFAVADAQHLLALLVFVGAAVLVSSLVSLAHRRAEQVAVAAAQAEATLRIDQTRTALLRAVSHDLRTPLASARAAVAGLRAPALAVTGGPADELLATADTSLARLSRVIENLLDLSRLEAGAMSVFPRPVALEDAAAHAVREADPTGRRVRIDIDESVPEALADPGLLERVLVNLLTNGLRHHRGAGPVVLSAETIDPGTVVIHVSDRGPGIARTDRETLFEPFQRQGDTSNTTGLGLGLALARGLSRAMGGDLRAGETPGGGATMTVTLPAVTPATSAIPPGAREQPA